MYIKPDSTVTLYTGIELSRKLVFSSIANQRAYFAQHVAAQTVDCTMIKKTGQMKLAISGSVVKNCNYLSFTNPSFDNKVFYAKILNYDYTNNEVTTVSYGIDYFQSFMFDVTFRQCYIDREHLSQADYAKSLVDPYDPSILEFQTEEGLPVGRQLEQRMLTFNKATTKVDGVVQDENCLVLSSCSGANAFTNADNYTLVYATPLQEDNLSEEDKTWYQNFIAHMSKNALAAFPGQSHATTYETKVTEFSAIGLAQDFCRQFKTAYGSAWLTQFGQELTYGNADDPDAVIKYEYYREVTNPPFSPTVYYKVSYTTQSNSDATAAQNLFDTFINSTAYSGLYHTSVAAVDVSQEEAAWDDEAGIIFADSNRFNCNKAMLTEFGYTPALSVSQTIADVNGFMSRPYNILVFSSMERVMELLQKFTIWNTISSIIAIYSIPRNMFASILSWRNNTYPYSGTFNPVFVTKDSKGLHDSEVVNKKLLNFPYCYMRVEGPDGTLKEYRYEDFANLYDPQLYDGKVRFLTSGEVQGIPVVSLIPTFYREYGINVVDDTEDQIDVKVLNYEERVDFSNFPQVPYCTDSFLAFLGAQATNYIAGLTSTTKYGLMSRADALDMEQDYLAGSLAANNVDAALNTVNLVGGALNVKDAFANAAHNNYSPRLTEYIGPEFNASGFASEASSGISSNAGGIASSARGLLNNQNRRSQIMLQARSMEHRGEELEQDINLAKFGFGDNSWATLDEDNEIYKRFKPAKRAFVVPNYQAGSTNGLSAYTNKAPFDFRFSHVHLRSDIMQKYDNYFSAFGYTSDRFGVPRIGNFIAGSADTTLLPQFMTVGNFQVTYVKTSGLNIECPMKPVEDYFIAMFDSGVQLINGDALIAHNNS